MASTAHIAVVDDHHDIRELMEHYLQQQGFRVSVAESGSALHRLLGRTSVDLILLDVMMPGEDGFTLCRELRAKSRIPIIFLTAKTDETDRVVGLELGADDYIVKPFSSRELLARVKAVLRRTHSLPPQYEQEDAKFVRFDRWVFDVGRRELQDRDGIGVPLSTAEFRLLKAFTERPGLVLSRELLLDLTVGREAEPFDRTIDNHVSRLRRKIEADPRNPTIIQTHWGGGYSFAAEVRRA